MSNFVKRVRDIMRNDAGINGDAQRIEQIAWMLFLKVYDAKEQDWEWDEEEYQSIIPEKCRWRNWGHDEDGKGMTGDILLDFINNTLFPTLKNLPVNADTPIKKAIVQTTFADANNYMKDGVLLRQVNNHAHVIDSSDELLLEYVATYINAINLAPYVTGTAQPKMNQEKMNSILIPIPPTGEQFRIVQKINQIFSVIANM